VAQYAEENWNRAIRRICNISDRFVRSCKNWKSLSCKKKVWIIISMSKSGNILEVKRSIVDYNICNLQNNAYNVRFEAFTAVTMKNVVFWDVALCRTWVDRRFGGTYLLDLQGGMIREG
jgi:hypothetical protein